MLLPLAALSPDVVLSKIKITAVKPAEAPVTFAGAAPLLTYQLEPDGLRFLSPIVMRITTDLPADGSVPLLFTLSGRDLTRIPSVEQEVDPKTRKLTFTAQITHFSYVVVDGGWFSVQLDNPRNHVLGEPFPELLKVTKIKKTEDYQLADGQKHTCVRVGHKSK